MAPTNCLLNVSEVGERVSGGATPRPVKFTLWGLLLAPSVIVSAPVRVPVAAGANLTLKMQLLAAGRLEPHVFVWLKSPVTTAPLIDTGRPELFVNVTVWVALTFPRATSPKLNVAGDVVRVTTPVPVSVAVCGLFDPLSVIVRAPNREPGAVGINRTSTSHDLFAGSGELVLQLLVLATLKSPLATILEKVNDVCWLLLTLIVCVALVPTFWFPKDKLPGLRLTGLLWPCAAATNITNNPSVVSNVEVGRLRHSEILNIYVVPPIGGFSVEWPRLNSRRLSREPVKV